jgi:hypothetical protein
MQRAPRSQRAIRFAPRARTSRTFRRAGGCGSKGRAGGGRRDDGRLRCTSTRVSRAAEGAPDASPHPARAPRSLAARWPFGRPARPRLIAWRSTTELHGRRPWRESNPRLPGPCRRAFIWIGRIGFSRRGRTDGESMAGRERVDQKLAASARHRIGGRCLLMRNGGRGGIRTLNAQVLDLLPLPGWATRPSVWAGNRGVEPRCSALETVLIAGSSPSRYHRADSNCFTGVRSPEPRSTRGGAGTSRRTRTFIDSVRSAASRPRVEASIGWCRQGDSNPPFPT